MTCLTLARSTRKDITTVPTEARLVFDSSHVPPANSMSSTDSASVTSQYSSLFAVYPNRRGM